MNDWAPSFWATWAKQLKAAVEYRRKITEKRFTSVVNPAGPLLDPQNIIAYAKVSGFNTVVVKVINFSNNVSVYANRRWIITLFPN